jgi:hypothetical protein
MCKLSSEERSKLIEYLQHIGVPLSAEGVLPGPTLKTLWQVHRQHALNIAFENLTFIHHKLKSSGGKLQPARSQATMKQQQQCCRQEQQQQQLRCSP